MGWLDSTLHEWFELHDDVRRRVRQQPVHRVLICRGAGGPMNEFQALLRNEVTMGPRRSLLVGSTAFLVALAGFGCTGGVGGGTPEANPASGGSATVGGDSDAASATDGPANGSTGSDAGGAGNGADNGAGTDGTSSSGGDDGPVDLTPVFSCSDAAVPESVPLNRLRYIQYRSTLEDLVALALPDSGEAALAELEPAFDRLPRDTRQGPDTAFAWFSRLDQTVQQSHVDEQYAISNEIAAVLTNSEGRLVEFVGDCALEESNAECVADFIRRFGELAQRRPLTDEDVEFYAQGALEEPYQAADYADVAALLLASPYLMYTVEHGQDPEQDSDEEPRVALSAYELASKLAYQFWQTLPDAELFEAARSGDLLT